MKKNLIIATGLLAGATSVAMSSESQAVNLNKEEQRSVVSLNKVGKVKNVASNDTLNVRTEPNTSGSIVFTLKNSTQVTVIGQDSESGWYKISYNNKTGFVSNRYIELVSDVSYQYVVLSDINIRKEPNWSSEKAFVAKKNQILQVISISGGWAKINHQGSIYYAPSDYLIKKDLSSGEEVTPPSQGPNVSTTKYLVTGPINLRKTESWSGEILGKVNKNEMLDVISISENWAKVYYKGVICYAPVDYLVKEGSNSTPDETPVQKTIIATVNINDLNVRAGAGMSYSIISKLNKGDIVLIKEKKPVNGWYKVELKSGIVGWCFESYLENFREGNLSSGSLNDASNNIEGKIATVNTNDLNIRSGSGTIYPVLSKANKGDTVLLKEKNSSGWYKVQLENGVIGWCNGVYLDNIRQGSLSVKPNNPSDIDTSKYLEKVLRLAEEQIGKPYVYGSAGPNSFDCSGLTYYVFKNGADITLPRNSSAQATVGQFVSKSNLEAGDLVFFNTSGGGISHVGIYVGNNEMIHAPSSGKNVQKVKINQSYWENRYVTARRILG